jgi:purine-cytosine permease-like protein
MFFGCLFGLLTGAVLTTTFKDIVNTPFVDGIFQVSPVWFVVPLVIYGFTGNIVNGAEGIYNAGLDLHSLLYFLRRSVVALIIGAVVVLLAYFGVIVFNAINTIDAFVVIMTVVITAWMVITILGYATRHGRIDRGALHAFAVPGARGRYWFTGGVNLRSVGTLAVAIVIGLLFTTTSTFSGPLASKVGGVDLSFTSAGIVAAVLYLALLKLFPEQDVVPEVVSAREPSGFDTAADVTVGVEPMPHP